MKKEKKISKEQEIANLFINPAANFFIHKASGIIVEHREERYYVVGSNKEVPSEIIESDVFWKPLLESHDIALNDTLITESVIKDFLQTLCDHDEDDRYETSYERGLDVMKQFLQYAVYDKVIKIPKKSKTNEQA